VVERIRSFAKEAQDDREIVILNEVKNLNTGIKQSLLLKREDPSQERLSMTGKLSF
jgi:hypothetical protein